MVIYIQLLHVWNYFMGCCLDKLVMDILFLRQDNISPVKHPHRVINGYQKPIQLWHLFLATSNSLHYSANVAFVVPRKRSSFLTPSRFAANMTLLPTDISNLSVFPTNHTIHENMRPLIYFTHRVTVRQNLPHGF